MRISYMCMIIWMCTVRCRTSCQDGGPYRLFSTRTAYDEVRGDASPDYVTGCTVKQVYMLVRHGARYPGRDEVELMQQLLPIITAHVLSPNNTGCVSPKQKRALESWTLPFHPDDDLGMTSQGLEDMKSLASRLKRQFPKLASLSKDDIANIDLRYTDTYRSVLSAKHFISGLMKTNTSLSQIKTELFGKATPRSQDRLLLYSDICYKYIRQRLYHHETEKDETAKFDDGKEIHKAADDVAIYMGLPRGFVNLTVMRGLYEACRYDYAIFKDSTWCDVLPISVLKAMEYRQDMRYYWRYGHGREVNYEPSCLLLHDVWNSFRSVTSGSRHATKIVLRFGHSRSILPFLVRLGYFNDSTALLASNYLQHQHRQWQLAKINPFSSNIALALYQCTDSQYRVKVLVNEHQMAPPACQDDLCLLTDLEKAWESILDRCDFQHLCDQDKAKDLDLASLNKNQFHHA